MVSDAEAVLAVVFLLAAGLYGLGRCGKGGVRGGDLIVALQERCGLLVGDVVGDEIEGRQVAPEAAGVVGGDGSLLVGGGFAEVLAPGQLVLQGVGVFA